MVIGESGAIGVKTAADLRQFLAFGYGLCKKSRDLKFDKVFLGPRILKHLKNFVRMTNNAFHIF